MTEIRARPYPPAPSCVCGHHRSEHRIDLKRAACDVGCGVPGFTCEAKCQEYTPQELLTQEDR